MINYPLKWEVWWAKVKFEGSDEVKRRPVLVCGKSGIYLLSCKVTSHDPRDNYEGEYLLDWQYCGLDCPSTARLGVRIPLLDRDFEGKIGTVSVKDVREISNILNRLTRK